MPIVIVIDWNFFGRKIVIDCGKLFKKTNGRQNDYNEKYLLEININHRLKITNVFSLVN